MLVARVRLLEVIQRGTAFLEERGVESPRLQVEWILAHHLRVPRLQLYLQFERDLDGAPLDAVRESIRRGGRREPLQHILGTAVFCGLEFAVGTDVLVPRPETEVLAEFAVRWLQARAAAAGASVSVLDWGTGSGCLAVVLAKRVPAARVVAVDRSSAALARAVGNARRLEVEERVRWVEGNGCLALGPDETFDLIVSNPPYIPSAEIATLAPEVRDFDPRQALDGGADGLDFYRRLAEELPVRLRPGGCAMLEFGDDQAGAIRSLWTAAGWIVDAVERDYSGRDRFLVARRSACPIGVAAGAGSGAGVGTSSSEAVGTVAIRAEAEPGFGDG